MSIEDDLDKLLETSKNPIESPPTREREGDWKAGVVWNGNEGTVTTNAIPAEEIPNWEAILRIWGLDPTKFKVVEPVLFNVWGDPLGTLNRQWKGRVVEIKSPTSEDLSELENEIKKHKPKVKVQSLGDGAFCVVLADWQIAKPDGDGLKGTLHRILSGIDAVETRIKELRKIKRPIGRLVILWTGDSVEGCLGHYQQQTFGVELDRRDQIKVARRLLRDAIVRWCKYFTEVSVIAVGGNHGENRSSGGKSFTTLNDNDDLAIVEQVAEILEANPEAYGHVRFAIPKDKLSITAEVAGWVLGITHGHAARTSGSTPEAKLRRWLEGQSLGRRSVGDSDVLVSGHYHHFRMADWGGCLWLQAPAMDGGSDWWEQMKGERSEAGILTFAMYPEKRVADLQIL